MDKIISIRLHDARTERPSKSGNYIGLKRYSDGYSELSTFMYSRKYDAFNASDASGDANAITIDYWAELPDMTHARDDAPPTDAEEPDYAELDAQEDCVSEAANG